MTRFRLVMAQAVRDLLIHLPPSLKRKVKTALHSLALAENPYQEKALKDDLDGLRIKWSGKSNSFFVLDKWTRFIMLPASAQYLQSIFLPGSCNPRIGVL